MSYRLYASKRNPVALWMLDDTTPFQEQIGLGYTAQTRAGYSNPTAAVGLVAGADFSSCFSKTKQGEFNSPLFRAGYEKEKFALEAWAYPVVKSNGYNTQTYRENLAYNPIGVNSGQPSAAYEYGSRWSWIGSWVTGATDSPLQKGTYNRQTSPATIQVAGGSRGTDLYINPDLVTPGTTAMNNAMPVTAGDVVTMSVWIRLSVASTFFFSYRTHDGVGNWTMASSGGSNVALTANTWTRMSRTVTIATTGYIGISLRSTSQDWPALTTMDTTGIMIEKGNPGPYFDGSMAGNEWVGTANASKSRTRTDVSAVNLATKPNDLSASNAGSQSFTETAPTTGGPLGGAYNRKTYTATTALVSGSDLFYTANAWPVATPGYYAAFAVWVRSSIAQKVRLQAQMIATISPGIVGGPGSEQSSDVTLVANQWTQLTFIMVNPVPAGNITVRLDVDAGVSPSQYTTGDTFDVAGATILHTPTRLSSISPFTGADPGAAWNGTAEVSESLMLISSSEQQILGNLNQMDGLTINGSVVSFVTKYADGSECRVYHDLQQPRAAHIVGLHDAAQNALFVDGVLVATKDLTDDQKNGTYVTMDTKLYSGTTTSSQEVAINGLAVYSNIDPTGIAQNFDAGRKTVPQARIYPQFDGMPFNLAGSLGSVFADQSWTTKQDFTSGLVNNINFSDEAITPVLDNNYISLAGDWTCAIPLDATGATSIYGVAVTWSGVGVTAQASLDGTTWTPIANGELVGIIPNGYNPTNKDLQVRFSFAGGKSYDDSFLESVRITGFSDNQIANPQLRTSSISYPAVPRQDYEPVLMRQDNGVYLDGGTLTIGPSVAAPQVNLAPNPRPTTGYAVYSAAGTTGNVESYQTTGGPTETPYWHKVVVGSTPTGSPMIIGMTSSGAARIPVTPGKTYSFSASAFASRNPAGGVRIEARFITAAQGALTNNLGTNTPIAPGVWETRTLNNITAPATAAYALVSLSFSGPTNLLAGDILGTSAIMANEGSTAFTYFDGATTGAGGTYAWTGTADASSSTYTPSNVEATRTFEYWIKPIAGIITCSFPGTKYRNGYADSTLPVGEWSLIHVVAAADSIDPITITGDCIVGQATVYPTALSASDINYIYDSYVGVPVVHFDDVGVVGVTEDTVPVALYAHDWSIDSGG